MCAVPSLGTSRAWTWTSWGGRLWSRRPRWRTSPLELDAPLCCNWLLDLRRTKNQACSCASPIKTSQAMSLQPGRQNSVEKSFCKCTLAAANSFTLL